MKTNLMRIEQSTAADTDAIFWLYHAATEYMAGRSTVTWPVFERSLVDTEIREGRQWKMTDGDEIVCVWAIALEDAQIWQTLDNHNAIYIHRIATHPAHRGKGFVKMILRWAIAYTKNLQRDFVRLDTVGENLGLIRHYQQSGFRFLGLSKLQDTEGLPAHYQNATVSLFELDIKNIPHERAEYLQS